VLDPFYIPMAGINSFISQPLFLPEIPTYWFRKQNFLVSFLDRGPGVSFVF
jgi:hypothetical protein